MPTSRDVCARPDRRRGERQAAACGNACANRAGDVGESQPSAKPLHLWQRQFGGARCVRDRDGGDARCSAGRERAEAQHGGDGGQTRGRDGQAGAGGAGLRDLERHVLADGDEFGELHLQLLQFVQAARRRRPRNRAPRAARGCRAPRARRLACGAPPGRPCASGCCRLRAPRTGAGRRARSGGLAWDGIIAGCKGKTGVVFRIAAPAWRGCAGVPGSRADKIFRGGRLACLVAR